ncbi:MAG: glycosyltransferase family 2 protein [Nitrospirae bacterium]|nr:glycosyltransferase family 2 protein [Nitrospirota bacterium]
MNEKIEVSIVIPVYNEERSITETLDQLTVILDAVDRTSEIIVVNDGSTDGTAGIVRNYDRVLFVDRKHNRGYGYSLKEGIEKARGEWILIADADGTYPLKEIPAFMKEMGQFDMIVGERSKDIVHMGILNRLAKLILKELIYILTYRWIIDINSGFRLFRKEIALKYFNIIPDGFSFTTTVTLISIIEKYRVKYIPIDYHKRSGKSHIRPVVDFFSFVILILRIITYFKPLRFFLPISFAFALGSVFRAVRDIMVENHIGSLAVILVFVSMQSFFFGLLADLIVTKFTSHKAVPGSLPPSDNSDGRADLQ